MCFNAGTGQCCAPDLVCGSVCCGGLDDKFSYCLNPATSTCCTGLQVVCGGKCCAAGQICDASGQCADPPPPVCEECQNNGDCDTSVDEHNKCNLTTHCCQITPF